LQPMIWRATRWRGLWASVWPILAGYLFLLAFHKVGEDFYDGYVLDLGSISWPMPRYVIFAGLWAIFATGAAGFLGLGLARFVSLDGRGTSFTDRSSRGSDLCWIALGSLAGLAIPLVLRAVLLQGAPLTDDESAYRFQAELLASGRLRGISPPLKLFFDRSFMINDGHLYAGYFLGWPTLLVPGVWLGVPGMVNAVYSALTVPPLFLVARRLTSSFWAKVGVLLYLFSPMLMVSAATELSHTSCIMALGWMTWFVFRSRDEDAPWWSHAGAASLFSVAFFNRPLAALGIALPLLIWWLLGRRALPRRQAAASLAAFLVPALVMGCLFLTANKLQNGSFTTTSYQRYDAYIIENGYRFTYGDAKYVDYYLRRPPITALPALGVCPLFRLSFDLFGWPSSFFLTFFAGTRRKAGLLWLSALSFFTMEHVALPFDSGIDSFGPVHYSEVAWPILLLSVLGLRALCAKARAWSSFDNTVPLSVQRVREWFPLTLTAALVLVTLAGFVVVRFNSVARIASNVNMPDEAVKSAGLHHATVFSQRPFAPNCRSKPTNHFVLWRPNNDPDLTNDILWVNHISVDQDRRLMEYFPDRKGYVLQWMLPCNPQLLPLDSLQPGTVPDGYIGGNGEASP
jgi:hypothetical protein